MSDEVHLPRPIQDIEGEKIGQTEKSQKETPPQQAKFEGRTYLYIDAEKKLLGVTSNEQLKSSIQNIYQFMKSRLKAYSESFNEDSQTFSSDELRLLQSHIFASVPDTEPSAGWLHALNKVGNCFSNLLKGLGFRTDRDVATELESTAVAILNKREEEEDAQIDQQFIAEMQGKRSPEEIREDKLIDSVFIDEQQSKREQRSWNPVSRKAILRRVKEKEEAIANEKVGSQDIQVKKVEILGAILEKIPKEIKPHTEITRLQDIIEPLRNLPPKEFKNQLKNIRRELEPKEDDKKAELEARQQLLKEYRELTGVKGVKQAETDEIQLAFKKHDKGATIETATIKVPTETRDREWGKGDKKIKGGKRIKGKSVQNRVNDHFKKRKDPLETESYPKTP